MSDLKGQKAGFSVSQIMLTRFEILFLEMQYFEIFIPLMFVSFKIQSYLAVLLLLNEYFGWDIGTAMHT